MDWDLDILNIKTANPYGKSIKIKSTKLYHTANPRNRESIMTNGLIPGVGNQLLNNDSNEYVPSIYVSYKPWDSTYDDDIWEIDTSKINNEFVVDNNMPDKAIVTFTKINPIALKLIHEGK
jgi:hypothetical protein